MGVVFLWWLAAELIGLASLPLAATVLGRLPDRGCTLAKPLGVLVLGWLGWCPLISLNALPYSSGWLLGTVLASAAGNAAPLRSVALCATLRSMITTARQYTVLSGLLFPLPVAVMPGLRAFTPSVVDTEKFM